MEMSGSSDLKPHRLNSIEGCCGKKNEVLYHPPNCVNPRGYIIFFGGDIQDYKENMLKHRDNKDYVKWDLESTCTLLHHCFLDYAIVIIKPVKMSLMTFSCYENFTEVNNFGAPTYQQTAYSLKHLQCIMHNLKDVVKFHYKNDCDSLVNIPIRLIGFSKGCIVLNQFLYSFFALNEDPDEDLQVFVNRITDLYWLEGGHSGTSETWVTNKAVLENFASMKKHVHIHVTPYQVLCDTRARIGKEEKIFRENLIRMGCKVIRVLHFSDEPRSLENHFQVLKVFHKPV